MRAFHREDPCLFVREKLELFLDGELSGSENLAFQTHLKECDDCAAHWSDDEIMAAALLVASSSPRTGSRRSAPRRPSVSAGGSAASPPPGAFRAWTIRRVAAAAVIFVGGGVVALLASQATKGEDPTPSFTVAASDAVSDASNRLVRGTLRRRRDESRGWSHLHAGGALVAGDRLWVDGHADALVALGDGSAMTLTPAAQLRLDTLPEAHGAPFAVDLTHGSVRIDVEGGDCSVRLPRAHVRAESATFVASSEHPGESLFVLRGEVIASTDLESRTVLAGHGCRLSREGRIVAVQTDEAMAELVRREDERDRSEIAFLRGEIERLREELARQQIEVRPEPAGARATPEVIIDGYLRIVAQSGTVNLDTPAPVALTTAADLRPHGVAAVDALVRRLSEEEELGRSALVVVLGLLEHPEARRVLERRSFDDDVELRHAALRVLARVDDPEIVTHFLAVMRSSLDYRSRLNGALQAARRGSSEGIDGAVELFHETDDPLWHLTIIVRLADLEHDRAAVDAFLHGLVADSATSSPALAAAAKGLARRGDRSAVPLLKTAALRPDLGVDLSRLVNEAIFRLESD